MQFDHRRAFAELARLDLSGMVYIENGWFGFGDSAMLFHFARNANRIVEVGSGYSTRIMRQATDGVIVSIDPEPKMKLDGLCDVWHRQLVQTMDPLFVSGGLKAGDILFIDSSHMWSAGDLPYLYEQVFPILPKGCLIHSHDIFLPDPYPPVWDPRKYDEQWHLEELIEGGGYEVIWPGYYMATRHARTTLMALGTNSSMGSFWMLKC